MITELSLFDTERLPRKHAFVTAVTRADQFRAGKTWNPVGSLPHNTPIEGIRHARISTINIGDEVHIYSFTTEFLLAVRITSMRLVHIAELTTEEIQAVGYDDLEDYYQHAHMGGKRFWYYDFERLTTSTP